MKLSVKENVSATKPDALAMKAEDEEDPVGLVYWFC